MVLHRVAALIGGLTVDGFVLDAKLQRRILFIWHS
jgi:AraC family transcriptional activator of tynA and feaB